ncbi:hypothetical protein KXW36_001343, partial [Aspergillus fumigatus]
PPALLTCGSVTIWAETFDELNVSASSATTYLKDLMGGLRDLSKQPQQLVPGLVHRRGVPCLAASHNADRILGALIGDLDIRRLCPAKPGPRLQAVTQTGIRSRCGRGSMLYPHPPIIGDEPGTASSINSGSIGRSRNRILGMGHLVGDVAF